MPVSGIEASPTAEFTCANPHRQSMLSTSAVPGPTRANYDTIRAFRYVTKQKTAELVSTNSRLSRRHGVAIWSVEWGIPLEKH